MIGGKPIRVWIDKIDEFIGIYDESRYLVLFAREKNELIYNRIRYPASQKSGYTYDFSCIYAKIKVVSYDSFFSRLHNAIILSD